MGETQKCFEAFKNKTTGGYRKNLDPSFSGYHTCINSFYSFPFCRCTCYAYKTAFKNEQLFTGVFSKSILV